MSQNMLVDKLRAAKQELTALKTVHRRGLGLLKIYTGTYDIPPPTGAASLYWLTVSLTFGVASYPFTQEMVFLNDLLTALPNTSTEFEYMNAGMGAEFRIILENNPDGYKVKFSSTSPILAMSYSWSEY